MNLMLFSRTNENNINKFNLKKDGSIVSWQQQIQFEKGWEGKQNVFHVFFFHINYFRKHRRL